MKKQQYWYLGFLGFVGFYYLSHALAFFDGESWTNLVSLVWFLWFVNFIPVKK